MFNNYVNVLDEKCFTSNVYDEKSSQELVEHILIIQNQKFSFHCLVELIQWSS